MTSPINPPTTQAGAAEDDTRSTVYAIVGAMAPVAGAELTDETTLIADLGYDSLRLLELTLALEQGLGLPELAPEETATVATLGDVVHLVSAARRQEAAR
ncbi:acyl carrier protein [Streptomyces sp. NPDC059788]|uniref:acyl carrier protein n=1 Tax=Streptomyces sp. NPDC059788 TaxID=3346948 RepID=UPI003666754F